MTLQDLKARDKVTIEIVRENDLLELETEIIGSNDKGLLMVACVQDGSVVEISSRKLKNAVVNLYCIDKRNGERRSWKGVNITTINHRNLMLYAAVVNNFGRYGVSGERRHDRRLLVERGAIIAKDLSREHFNITVHDVSDNGISFVASEIYDNITGVMKILLDDQVRGHFFRLEIPCECVRRESLNGQILYGCRVMSADKRFLEYVNLKRMEMRRA